VSITCNHVNIKQYLILPQIWWSMSKITATTNYLTPWSWVLLEKIDSC
jgi:hypothetical protein